MSKLSLLFLLSILPLILTESKDAIKFPGNFTHLLDLLIVYSIFTPKFVKMHKWAILGNTNGEGGSSQTGGNTGGSSQTGGNTGGSSQTGENIGGSSQTGGNTGGDSGLDWQGSNGGSPTFQASILPLISIILLSI